MNGSTAGRDLRGGRMQYDSKIKDIFIHLLKAPARHWLRKLTIHVDCRKRD
jgi:hypothetical protein